MRKKFIAGAAILALLVNSPQVSAEDEIVIFGGEFEDEAAKPAPKVEEPKPLEPKKVEPPAQVEPQEVEPPAQVKPKEIEPPAQIEPKEIEQPVQVEPKEIEPPVQVEPKEIEQPVQVEPKEIEQLVQVEPQEIEPPVQIEPQEIEPPVQVEPQEIEPPIQVEPQEIEPPIQVEPQEIEPPIQVEPLEVKQPFEPPTEISNEWQERVEEPAPTPAPRYSTPQQNLKTLSPRFIKLAVDDMYIYYLDKNSVEWKRLPYSSSEYMADVWVRMIEREPKTLDDDMAAYGADNFRAQIALAREQGYQYPPEDIKVLRQQNYVLEHYYLRPKTKQIQFLCELEVFGRPQNTINERAYDYQNWENLVPGSVEASIYDATIKIIGKSKASERGHMTFIDMLDEYARIALN